MERSGRALGLIAGGAAVGCLAGFVRGLASMAQNGHWAQGLTHLALRELAATVLSWTGAAALVVLAWMVAAVLLRPLVSLVRGAGSPAVVGAVVAPPVLALYGSLGLYLNREHLPGVFEPASIAANVALTVAAVIVWLVVSVLAGRVLPAVRGRSVPHPRWWILAMVPLLAIAATQAARLWSTPDWPEGRPNVLVIVVDALRADRLGCYGHDRPTSPRIDALAADSWRFTQAVSVSSWTKPAIASLFTSRYPRELGIGSGTWSREDETGRVRVSVLGRSAVTLAERLANAGYDTAGFGKNHHLTAALGFGQGFQSYALDLEDEEDDELSAHSIADRFLGWLDRHPRRFFAYLHYIDVHWPYAPPDPFRSRFAGPPPETDYNDADFMDWADEQARRGPLDVDPHVVRHMSDAYDEGIAFVDDQVGILLDELRRRGVYDETLIVFTSDHGDEFLEHGSLNHGSTLYDELLRVPLLVKFPCPGSACGPRVVDTQASLVDLMPTILTRAGLAVPPDLRGRDLAATGADERPAFAELGELGALRTPRFKYLRDMTGGGEQLYDLLEDPGETSDLLDLVGAEVPEAFREELAAWWEATRTVGPVEEQELDAEELERLRELGYVN